MATAGTKEVKRKRLDEAIAGDISEFPEYQLIH